MVQIMVTLPLSIAVLVATAGSFWFYRDATDREMDTADMWAVGFFVAFFVLPLIGGLLVLVYYSLLHVRNSGRGTWRRSASNCEVFQQSVSYGYISEMSASTLGKSRETDRIIYTNEAA